MFVSTVVSSQGRYGGLEDNVAAEMCVSKGHPTALLGVREIGRRVRGTRSASTGAFAKIRMFPIAASRWDLGTWNHTVPAPAGPLAAAPVSSATDTTSVSAKKSKHRPQISCCTNWKGAHSRGAELWGLSSHSSWFSAIFPRSGLNKQTTYL